MFTHIGFQSIAVEDFDRALAFYRDKMGLAVERDEPYGDSRWIFMKIPGARTMLHFEKSERIETRDTPALVFVTEDVDKTCETLKSRGVPIHAGPDDAPWNPGTRWALIHDSETNLVLIETV